MNQNNFFSEIIEGNLSSWTGQCWKWDNIPNFASLLITTHKTLKLYGIVTTIKTGSSDPIRTPTPYQKTEEELLYEQPQIFDFLQTTFTCITLGYQEQNKIFYNLPGSPPKIHAFIKHASQKEYQEFFTSDQYLHLLFNQPNQIYNIEELLLTLLKDLAQKKVLNKTNFINFIETFSLLCKNDYQKLKIFLQRANLLLTNIAPQMNFSLNDIKHS